MIKLIHLYVNGHYKLNESLVEAMYGKMLINHVGSF